MNNDQNQHKLILLRGNSGSGKTTLAHMLQRKLGRGTLVISQDVIRRDMLWAKDTKDGPAVPLLMELVQYGRRHCEYVILEGILFSETYEALFQCIQSEYAAEDIPITMTSPLRKPFAAMRRSPTGLISAWRPCGSGGRRRTISVIFRRKF